LELKRIESGAFDPSYCGQKVPSTILFVASDAFRHACPFSLTGGVSSPGFYRWKKPRQFEIDVDFRRILRAGSGFVNYKAI
jgi:hypothetical protein